MGAKAPFPCPQGLGKPPTPPAPPPKEKERTSVGPPMMFFRADRSPLTPAAHERIKALYEEAIRIGKPMIIDGLDVFQLINGEWREVKPSNAPR